MRHLGFTALLLLMVSVLPADAAFRATNVEAGWRGFNDDPSGTGDFKITGIDDAGRTVVFGDIRGFGHNLTSGTGTTQISFDYDGLPGIFPISEGLNVFIDRTAFSKLTVDGVEQGVTDVSGYFRVDGPFDVPSGVPVGTGADAPFATGTVDDLPVAFSFDLQVRSDDVEYALEGAGTGSADLSFSTWAPSNLLVLQTGAEYDLTPANAVPEPTAIMVWLGCFAIGAFFAAARRNQHRA